MTTLSRGQVSSVTNPLLDIHVLVDGVATDVDSLSFIVSTHQPATGAETQVYPILPAGPEVVDFDANKLHTGHYAIPFTALTTYSVGVYALTVYFTIDGGPQQSYTKYFEIISAGPPVFGSAYTTVAALRAEGVPSSYADTYVYRRIVLASQTFENYTGRRFGAVSKTITVDGKGNNAILLDEPVIGVSNINITVDDAALPGGTISLDDIKVYNRHITQQLFEPDDREAPRIEIRHSEWRGEYSPIYDGWTEWPRGNQNVEITGVFGYTDPDGTPTGGVPMLVERAVQMLALRDMPRLSDTHAREDAAKRWMLTGERTRDQSYTLFSGVDAAKRSSVIGGITGDPELDRIIIQYTAGPRIRAV